MQVDFRRRTSRGYVACGLIACLAYLVLPRSSGAQVLFVAIAFSAPAVGLLAIRGDASIARHGRRLLAAGFVISAIGELADFVFITLKVSSTSNTVIDLLFLTAYIVQLCGLMSLYRSRTVSRHQFGWFDAAAVGVVVLTVVWTTMYQAIFGHGRATPLDWITRFGGAVFGVALVVTALRLVLGARGRDVMANLLLAGFLLQLTTDSVAALWIGYTAGGALDTLWAVAYVMMGAAMLRAPVEHNATTAPTRLANSEIKHTLVLQAAVTILLATIIVIQVGGAVPVASLIGWGLSWLVILVITRIRIFSLLRLVGEASATENQRRLTAMVASSSDVIGIADPDGTVRYLSPAIGSITGVAVEAWIGQRFDTMLDTHFTGLHDIAARCALLGSGEYATWECTVTNAIDDTTRTVKLTLANHLDSPEVSGWVITAHDMTDEARLTSELRHQSMHDTLTGLPNRGLLFDRIQHSLDRMSRIPDAFVSVVLVDIDDFKAVNDSLGHTTGDELLRAVAERLASSVRQGDTVARLGGDEFAMLFEDTDEQEAMGLAQRALESLALPVHMGSGDFAVRASAGVVCHRGTANPVELLRSADIAMYASKRDGKSKVTLFQDAMHDLAREHLELRMDLAVALEHDEFVLVYQPIMDTQAKHIAGAEALLRWNHPRRGLVSPVDFIPIAEQSGDIAAIGEWVMRTACAEASGWAEGGESSYISVNVAAPQLQHSGFYDLVVSVLADTGLAPRRLMIEITESMLVDDSANARMTLSRLRALGIRIAIDDFGTGYSSLAYLRSLSVDVVKIDQSFVRDVGSNSDHQALTRTILALADGLDMTAIAEGVETGVEFAELERMGCLFAQGYLFSRPITPIALQRMFERVPRAAAMHASAAIAASSTETPAVTG
ncbi:MAG: hypothetical protein JWM34_2385 [Ilumatobacteraceae bacterium]|nr:hypothetical protein [Ilumatobacteraceae bacterium]